MTISIPPGVFDIVPSDPKELWRNSYLWQYVESIMRATALTYGYQEIRTPLFERTELFQRGVGETTDIVSKEMYTFEDRGGRSMSLRPEGTAPAIRSFIENQLYNNVSTTKLFYIAPMFRYERTQAGRYRQHHQFGVEAIGSNAPEQDAEAVDLIYTVLSRIGIKHLSVSLNSIGDIPSRKAYREALKNYLGQYFDGLSADSKLRYETNPLRILDSKDPSDKEIIKGAPSILGFLNDESIDHFERLKKLLAQLKIPFEVNPQLVRGLDYYNKTVFEIVAGELGAQNSIVGGGRYDGLIKTLGGPDLPALGFGSGIERVIQTLIKQNGCLPSPHAPLLYLIGLGDNAKNCAFSMLHELRNLNIPAQMDFSEKKLNKMMHTANQLNARFVAVIGDQEIEDDNVGLKEMASGQIIKVPLSSLVNYIQSRKD